jgi:membrane-associated phospholipid phosphatase
LHLRAFIRALRSSEWLLIAFFGYVALISPAFPLEPRVALLPLALVLLVSALFVVLAYAEAHGHQIFFSMTRDWLSIALMLVAYREMDLFSPLARDHHLELQWVAWDRVLLYDNGLRRAIESLGWAGPAYLEFCYLLVYAVGPFVVAVLYFKHHRKRVNSVVFYYLLGTLLSYALFPYFPSDPPRVVFPGTDLPHVITAFRRLNLWLLGGYAIHSSVFPSAHVSSAFSAAWAWLAFLPGRKRYGYLMLIYACSVAVATVYGRYHYAADVVAGFGISLIPGAMILLVRLLRLRHVLPLLP